LIHFYKRQSQSVNMASMGFFIDTGGRADTEEDEEVGEVVAEEAEAALGVQDVKTEAKMRQRASKERSLASFLFGKTSQAASDDESDPSDKDSDDNVDNSEEEVNEDSESGEEDDSKETPSSAQPSLAADLFLTEGRRKRKAAWQDEEAEEVLVRDVVASYSKAVGKHGEAETSSEQYHKAVSRKFKSVVGEPSWASLDREEEGDSDEEFFRETTEMLDKRGRTEYLQSGYLNSRKLKDLNFSSHREGAVITAAEFHPSSTVGLVAGNNGTITLMQVDGKENPKIQTINFKNFPIKTAKFSSCGNEFIVSSNNHPHFFVYDMIAGQSRKVPWRNKTSEQVTGKFDVSPDGRLMAFVGRFGNIHLISGRTKELVRSIKMNETCHGLRFSRDGSNLFSIGDGGELYIWDVRNYECLHKFQDEGCLVGTAVDVSNTHLATGSSSGVVNIYNVNSLSASAKPKPEKAILNLTTQIDSVRFNPSGEMLAMSSISKETAVKIVHLQTQTVFQNFPGTFSLGKVNSLAFSPGGGYMAIGNNKGAANLYRINHYNNY